MAGAAADNILKTVSSTYSNTATVTMMHISKAAMVITRMLKIFR